MNDTAFVETKEHRLFHEFCDACKKYRYIGLCYGPPGVGKTLSARYYAHWDKIEPYVSSKHTAPVNQQDVSPADVLFYTVPVVNSPNQLRNDVHALRKTLHDLVLDDLYQEREARITAVYDRERQEANSPLRAGSWYRTSNGADLRRTEALEQIHDEFRPRFEARPDPTRLVLVDETDRLKIATLEQLRAVFDVGDIGLVLIGMPGLEKRLARYPQLYSRVGFVHQFRPLAAQEVRGLLQRQWCPPGTDLPEEGIADEQAVASVLRITGGNFRLLARLLTQIARVLEVNEADEVTVAVVEAARESLVIGAA
jgi:DNA transposition AAA+ family ATPase